LRGNLGIICPKCNGTFSAFTTETKPKVKTICPFCKHKFKIPNPNLNKKEKES